MSKSHLLGAASACLMFFFAGPASATTVSYDVANISGNTWEYNYTVTNDTLATDIEEFSIFFTLGDYENLAAAATPADWDPLVLQPDPGLPDDGLYDALALVAGIAPGTTLGSFSVTFDYLGVGIPGAQDFEIIDPNNFSVIESGFTSPALVVPVPAAAPMFAVSTGLLLAAFRRRQQSGSR